MKINRFYFILVIFIILSNCAKPTVVSVKMPGDSNLNCEDLKNEYHETRRFKEEAIFAKNAGGNAKIKLVIQSDVQGSFQGKDFILTEDWTMYTHTFNLKSKSKQNGVKFWFMTAGTTYLLDDVSISK